MNITCEKCKTKLNIPDHKIPKDKDTTVKCPKCQGKISIHAQKLIPPAESITQLSKNLLYDPLSEEKISALICIDEGEIKKRAFGLIQQMGPEVETAKNASSALKMMEYQVYSLLVIDAAFDSNKGLDMVVQQMNKFDMSLRRRTCIVLISKSIKTNDNMAAMHASVNQTIHINDMDRLGNIILRALKKHRNFYKVYNDSLKATGKA
ncbi:MAG: hypothetical protein GY729_11210 [Desulfobacteraceae bacterium]|nr:hypothetical protein [Desulfobacteraceae bacterium]